jgi:hypothetical protein
MAHQVSAFCPPKYLQNPFFNYTESPEQWIAEATNGTQHVVPGPSMTSGALGERALES